MAQTIDRYAVTSAGENLKSDRYEMQYTLGETVAQTFNNGLQLTQGIQQVWLITTAVGDITSNGWNVNVFQNPTGGILNVESQEKLKGRLFDSNGRILLENSFEPGTESMDLSYLAPGAYYLALHPTYGLDDKSFRVLKIQ